MAFSERAIVFDLTAMVGGLLYIFVATQGAEDLLRGTSDFFSLEQKAYALSSGAEFYNRPLGLIVSFAAMVLAGLALRNKWCVFAPKMAWICAAFLALVILMPTSVLGIWGLHLRFSSTILILFGASILPSATVTAPVRNLYGRAFEWSLYPVSGQWRLPYGPAEPTSHQHTSSFCKPAFR